MAFIRNYKSSDFDATAHICVQTLAPNLVGSKAAEDLGPYVWTHQYTHLSPSTSFVLDDGTGHAVGYCIGCPDIPSFITAYPNYVSEIVEAPNSKVPPYRPADVTEKREPWRKESDGSVNGACLAQQAYNPTWLLMDGNEDLIVEGKYRATMHIDLLDEYQGKGWGRKLIDQFVAAVQKERQSDTKGIWIGVAGDNSKVVGFYEKLGFRKLEGPEGGSIRMVKDLQ